MDALTMIKERRSVRKFKDEKVDRNTLEKIILAANFAPTWAHGQINRYTVIEDKEIISKLTSEGLSNFQHNMNILSKAPGVVVVSAVKGISGRSPQGDLITSKGDSWEMFDAGIASQTFCLAAHTYNVGTVIMGIFDDVKVAEIINLPENEVVTTVIPYGYIDGNQNTPPHKSVTEVTRYI